MNGWQDFGASLVVAACMLPPGLALAVIIGACRACWVGASKEEDHGTPEPRPDA